MTTEEIEESFLSAIAKEIRIILSENDYMIAKCKDTMKPSGDPFIFTSALELKNLVRDYTCSVYHTTKEIFETNNNGSSNVKGIIYLDFHRKVNQKKGEITTDEIDKFTWTALQVLFANPSLNGKVDKFELMGKQLWEQMPSPNSKSDNLPDSIKLNYICQVILVCHYTFDYFNYE